ncbi:hypothetical protein SESBI_33539 [Sesbania bispinosa]|nr:hypothetical protein SESBI_33539 [Sesbania bispinosa]
MDVSSWLLIEVSADSEVDSAFFPLCLSSIAANTGNNEDDTESCNCDTASICGLPKDGACHEDDQGFGESCGDEDVSYVSDCSNSTMWMSIATLEDEVETKIGKVNINNVKEMEDRLFWETCMAVGYP